VRRLHVRAWLRRAVALIEPASRSRTAPHAHGRCAAHRLAPEAAAYLLPFGIACGAFQMDYAEVDNVSPLRSA